MGHNSLITSTMDKLVDLSAVDQFPNLVLVPVAAPGVWVLALALLCLGLWSKS